VQFPEVKKGHQIAISVNVTIKLASHLLLYVVYNCQKSLNFTDAFIASCDIIRRIGLASSNMGKLDRVWSNRQLNLSSKLRIYKCCILALLLYGFEAWTILKADQQKLQFPSALPAAYIGGSASAGLTSSPTLMFLQEDVHSTVKHG